MPTPVFSLALQSQSKPRSTDDVLVVFPDRVEGPDGTPREKALALLAALAGSQTLSRGLPALGHSQNDRSYNLHSQHWFYPSGAWEYHTRGAWAARCDASVSTPNGAFGLVCGSDRWETIEAFMAPPSSVIRVQNPGTKDWDHPWWDSTTVGVLLGAIKAHGALAFNMPGTAIIAQPWMYIAVGAAARVLHPWLGDPKIPARGYDSRPFPLKAPIARVLEETAKGLIREPGTPLIHQSFMHRSWLNALAHTQVLVPNAPYAATAWIPGPNWDKALARFPDEIIAAGYALGKELPKNLPEISPQDMISRTVSGTGHTRLATLALLKRPDTILRAHAPTYARGRKTTRKAA